MYLNVDNIHIRVVKIEVNGHPTTGDKGPE
jgi:hypothetical protein